MNMNITELTDLIKNLQNHGVQFTFANGQLHIKSPPAIIDSELKKILKQNKELIIQILNKPIRNRIPLLESQKGLWFLQQIDPESTAYNISGCYEIRSELNINALEKSLSCLVNKHELLRCYVEWMDNDLYFIESNLNKLPLIINQINHDQLDIVLKEQLQQPFVLQQAPLFHIFLNQVATTKESYYLHIVIHHILADAWSCGIIAKDLANYYFQLSNGESLEIKESHYRFSDFVDEYEEYKSSHEYQSDLIYWKNRLSHNADQLKLPTDFSRPEKIVSGETINHVISSQEWNIICQKIKQIGVSEFQYFISLYSLLLHKYSQQKDFTIGYPVSGRYKRQHEEIIGNIINVLPLRMQIEETNTLKKFILDTQNAIFSDLEHQKFPFSQILKAVSDTRKQRMHPIFQHLFVMQNTSMHVKDFEHAYIKPYTYPTGTAKFDLCLSAIPLSTGELQLSLEFCNQLYHSSTAKTLLDTFVRLAKSSFQLLKSLLSDICLTETHNWDTCIIKDPEVAYTQHEQKNVIELFKEIVRNQPNNIAIRFQNETLSYSELDKKSNDLAQALIKTGVNPGDLIGIALDRNLDLVPTILAILKINAAYLPLDLSSPIERLRLIVEDAKPRHIITNSNSSVLFHSFNTAIIDIETLMNSISSLSFTPNIINQSDLVYVIYTSGSTGRPNGVPITHSNLVRLFSSTQRFFKFCNTDIWTLFHSYAFDFSVWEMWGALLYGGTLIVVPQNVAQNTDEFAKLVCSEKVTILNQTPSAFYAILHQFLNSNSALRYIILAGEALDVAALSHWFKHSPTAKIINSYGTTETTVLVTLRMIQKTDIDIGSRSPIGFPMDDLEILILDKNRNPVPSGFPGELCIMGPGLSKGYLNNDKLTELRFSVTPSIQKRIYHSGDLARRLYTGELEYLGRIDKQVKIRGYRIELGEVEHALLKVSGIREAVVLCQFHSQTHEKYLSAYLVLADNDSNRLSENEIRSILSKHLPLYMVPTYYFFISSIPLNVNGKIAQDKLLSIKNTAVRNLSSEKNHTQLEETILNLIQELMQKKIEPDDNFFEIGAHSLLLVQAQQLLKEKINRDIPIAAFFEYPNVRKLASHLETNLSRSITHSNLKNNIEQNEPIAVIGMACRFPDANTWSEFWENIYFGKESVKEIPITKLSKSIYKPNSRYIPFTAWIEDIDQFDANFFNISAKEAELMDPQQRLLLEIAYHALEDAGYNNIQAPQNIGIFTSSSMSRYLLFHILNNQLVRSSSHPLLILLGNDKDTVATRLAFKLNCTGPAINIQTACSSSLVAIHEAVQSLRRHECEMAMAGGISINPLLEGYFYEEGGIGSSDGHCRPFDHYASGTVSGNGGALVILKTLSKALQDNDKIYAVIKGSAVNNDGANKVGFVAPSVQGQVQVIERALHNSGLNNADVTFIEAHGTATSLGDVIEFQALDRVYGNAGKTKYLASTKANIGHLDVAAGVASFIKTVLALHHKCIPPQINFEKFHDNFHNVNDFSITTRPLDWKISENEVRTAAVSSLGLGGTNAHVILQEFNNTQNSNQIITPPIYYAFSRKKYWIDPIFSDSSNKREPQLFCPTWKQVSHTLNTTVKINTDVIFIQNNTLGESIAALSVSNTITVIQGNQFKKIDAKTYCVNPENLNDYSLLWKNIKESNHFINKIVYAWSFADSEQFDYSLFCLFAPMYLLQTVVGSAIIQDSLSLKLVRNRSSKIFCTDIIQAETGFLDSIALTVPQELSSIKIETLDVLSVMQVTDLSLLKHWLNDSLVFNTIESNSLSLRSGVFWKKDWDPYQSKVNIDNTTIQLGSTIVISGSTGIASVLALHLIKKYQCKVICLTRKNNHTHLDDSAINYVTCNITDLEAVETSFAFIVKKYGSISAIFHLAGKSAEKLFIRKNKESIREALHIKTLGARHLEKMTRIYSIPKLILFSSASAELGGIGELEYCAANRFLDALALENDSGITQITSINWAAWAGLGMREKMFELNPLLNDSDEALSIEEALALVDQSLCCPFAHLAALPYSFKTLNEKYKAHLTKALAISATTSNHRTHSSSRPELATRYRQPNTNIEKQICSIWEQYLGIDKVGLDDNFFDLGGDSLTALDMKQDIENAICQELNLDTFIRNQTVGALISHLINQKAKPDPILVQLAKSEENKHLFCVHAVMGTIFPFIDLANKFDSLINFYAIQSPHLTNENDFETTLPALANRYISSLKKQQPQGPYFLAGWSFGALVAYEMAKQLIVAGEDVAHLYIIDMAIQSETLPDFSISEEEVKHRFVCDMQNVFNKELREDNKEFQSLFAVFQNHIQMTKSYFEHLHTSPTYHLPCHCTIFSAQNGMLKNSPTRDLGWKPYLSHYQLIELEGDHYSILKSPSVSEINKNIILKFYREEENLHES